MERLVVAQPCISWLSATRPGSLQRASSTGLRVQGFSKGRHAPCQTCSELSRRDSLLGFAAVLLGALRCDTMVSAPSNTSIFRRELLAGCATVSVFGAGPPKMAASVAGELEGLTVQRQGETLASTGLPNSVVVSQDTIRLLNGHGGGGDTLARPSFPDCYPHSREAHLILQQQDRLEMVEPGLKFAATKPSPSRKQPRVRKSSKKTEPQNEESKTPSKDSV